MSMIEQGKLLYQPGAHYFLRKIKVLRYYSINLLNLANNSHLSNNHISFTTVRVSAAAGNKFGDCC